MNEELDSQLSAMFDDELPAAECELLARRLSRDEQLKARWGRYAVIGAAIRAERGVRLNARLAGRVSAIVRTEPALDAPSAPPRDASRWWRPLAGAAMAAGVAAASILWLRAQAPGGALPVVTRLPAVAARNTPLGIAVPASASTAPEGYLVPQAARAPMAVVPTTELANYVVAHSMFSSPVARRNLLSAFMTGESATLTFSPGPEAAAQELQHDVKTSAQ